MLAWTKKDLLAGRLIVSAGVKAILFDLDGVIVDSARFERQAVEEMLGTAVDEEIWNEFFALPVSEFFAELNEALGLELGPERLDEMTADLDQLRVSAPIPLVPGVREIIEAARPAGLRIAVVSNNSPEQIRTILDHHDLVDSFEVICGLGPGLQAKPVPDLYRQAQEALGLEPGECLAVEDSPQGLAAARSAGLRTASLRVGGAEVVYRDFNPALIKIAPGDPQEKELRAGPDFLSHMIEHVLWRCSMGGTVVWSNSDFGELGRQLGQQLDWPDRQMKSLGIIDESLARVTLLTDQLGLETGFVYPWLPGRRVEDLLDGGPLLDLLRGIGEGTGLGIRAEILATRDPHHAWEALFRALGTALSGKAQGKVEIPKAQASRNTAESRCEVRVGGPEFRVEVEGGDWEGLLAGFRRFALRARFSSTALVSSHVIAEDLGIALGQALRRSAEQAMARNGIEGFGSREGRLASVAVSLEGRSTYTPLSSRPADEIDRESFGQDLPGGLRIEDLDDFLFGLSQGMGASIVTLTGGPAVESWTEIFELLPLALEDLFASCPERRGLIPGVKATID